MRTGRRKGCGWAGDCWWPGLLIHFSASSHFDGIGFGTRGLKSRLEKTLWWKWPVLPPSPPVYFSATIPIQSRSSHTYLWDCRGKKETPQQITLWRFSTQCLSILAKPKQKWQKLGMVITLWVSLTRCQTVTAPPFIMKKDHSDELLLWIFTDFISSQQWWWHGVWIDVSI